MTDMPADGQSRLGALLDRVAFDREKHLGSLVEAAKSALAEKRPSLAWLAADRLFRITGGIEAAPLMLRSAAQAALGEAEAARADFKRASELDPAHPLILHALLRNTDASRRLEGAVRAFQSRGLLAGAAIQPALAVLARDGLPVALVDADADGLSLRQWWTGAKAPELIVSDGARVWPVEAHATRRDPHGAYPHYAEARFAWPDDVDALMVTASADTLVEPRVVLRPAAAPSSGTEADGASKSPGACLVILPIYGDAASAGACIDSLRGALPLEKLSRVVIVDDAGPDPQIRALIAELEQDGRFTLLKNPFNIGFAASVNRGLRKRRLGEHVLLLNSDVILPPGAIERLVAVAGQDGGIATVTPLSNNGEDTSIPKRLAANPLPAAEEIARLDALAWQTNGVSSVNLVNGVGFCLFITSAALNAAGPLPTSFGRGYYEDVAFCLTAAEAGFRNVCATGVYVGHAGSRSFQNEKRTLIRRNLARLTEAFPNYAARSAAFQQNDPLLPAARAIERADLADASDLRLVLVAEDCPPVLAEQLIAAMPVASLRTIFVFQSADRVRLRGTSEAMPQTLDFDEREWTGVRAALALSGKVKELVLIDPAALPPADIASVLTSSATLSIVHASSVLAGRPPPEWLPADYSLFTANSLLNDIVEDRWPRRAKDLVTDFLGHPAARRGKTKFSFNCLAVRASRFDEATRALLAVLANRLRSEHPDLDLILLGREETDLALMQELGIWVTGEMLQREILPFLQTAGAAGLVLIDRAYGLASGDLDDALLAGLPTARFDPRPADRVRPWFALDPFADDPAVAAAIIQWVTGLKRGDAAQAETACSGGASMLSEEV